MRTPHALAVAALLAAAALTGCGGDDEPTAGDNDTQEPTSSAPTSEPTTAEPEPTEAAPELPLADACAEFAAGWSGQATKKGFATDADLALSIREEVATEGYEAFGDVAFSAQAALDSLGTFEYIDAEEAWDNAVVALNDTCASAGTPIFES